MEDEQIVDLYWQRSDLAISETNQKYGRYCHTIAYNICGIDEDDRRIGGIDCLIAVDIGILQPAQVALIAAVQQVFGCDVQLGNLPAVPSQIGACREIQQRVAGSCALSIIYRINMTLLQVAFQSCRDVKVVSREALCVVGVVRVIAHSGMGVVHQLPLQLRCPSGRWGVGQMS